jgi:hypothetical protein
MALEDLQLPLNSSPSNGSLSVSDIQSVDMPGYTDVDYTQDLINQNQSSTPIVSSQPDPYSQSVIDSYNSQFTPQAIGPQGMASLYPGMSLPEQMGTYSGSIIGSNPLMAPGGGVMAIDPVLARRKAIEDAARARASSLVPFEPQKPFQLKDPRFQQKYEQQVLAFQSDFTEEMKKKYGKDWTIVAKDPNTKEGREFIQAMANYETLGREFDGITDRVAAIDEGLDSGDLEFSDDTLKVYDDYKQLLGDFEGGSVFKSRDLQSELDKLDGFLSLEGYINDSGFLDNIMGEQGAWSQISDQGEYFQTSTGTVVKFDEAIDQVTESLARGPMRNAIRKGYMTPDKIKKTLQSKFKTKRTAKKSISQKRADAVVSQEISSTGESYDQPRADNNFTYNEDGTLSATQASPGQVYYRHDMNIEGDNKKVSWKDSNGNPKTLSYKGIKFTQPKVLNGAKVQDIEGDVVSQVSGFTTTQRDGNTVVVANTTSWVPTKQRYDDEGQRIPYEQWSGAGGKRKAERTEIEYREVQTPIILVDENGDKTGSFDEIQNQLKDDSSRESLNKAFENANKVREEKSGSKSAAGDNIFN